MATNPKILAKKREQRELTRRTEMKERIRVHGDTESPAVRARREENNAAIRRQRGHTDSLAIHAYLGQMPK